MGEGGQGPKRADQRQASGLMGSPTVPSTRSDDRSWGVTCFSPKPIRLRISVGAV